MTLSEAMKIPLFALMTCAVVGCSRTEQATPPERQEQAVVAEEASAPEPASDGIPDTDIFVADLDFRDGAPAIGALTNATAHPGYDNQPYFVPDGGAFYYVAEGENGKTDIWLHDIARAASLPVFTSSDVSEFSPKISPDGERISYIQEDVTGEVTRVHWRRADGAGEGEAVSDFEPLGYYVWLKGGAMLGVYYRSEPGSLYLVDIASGKTTLLHDNIGRALQADDAGSRFWFTQGPPAPADEDSAEAAPAGPFKVMRYDVESGAISQLFDLPENAQDFSIVFTPTGEASSIFSAGGTTLYYRPISGADWTKVADLAPAGIANATRVAVSADHKRLAVVGERVAQ